jgi:hypothetical protein
MPTIPIDFHMLMVVPCKRLKHCLPLTCLHVPTRLSWSTQCWRR